MMLNPHGDVSWGLWAQLSVLTRLYPQFELLTYLSVDYKYFAYIICLVERLWTQWLSSKDVNKIDLEICHTGAMKLLSNEFIIMNNLLL